MPRELPEPADDESYYRVKVKGQLSKPNYWGGYVLATNEDHAERMIRENHPELGLGVLGIQYVNVHGTVEAAYVRERIRGAGNPNDAIIEEDGEVVRVHRGMLSE